MCEAWFRCPVLKVNKQGGEKKHHKKIVPLLKRPCSMTGGNPPTIAQVQFMLEIPSLVLYHPWVLVFYEQNQDMQSTPRSNGGIMGCSSACERNRKVSFLTFYEHSTLFSAFFIESQLLFRTILKQHSHLHFAYLHI